MLEIRDALTKAFSDSWPARIRILQRYLRDLDVDFAKVLTDAGCVRGNNEDAIAFDAALGLMIPRRYNGGEVASGMTIALLQAS